MKRITKIILSFILILGAVVLPVCGNVASYKADEATSGTQGVLTSVNYVDYNFGSFNDIMVFATEDSTQTLLTLTGQDEATFAWWYNFVLEYNEEKGTWVVTKADMSMADGANQNCTEPLGPGKMVIMFHDNVTKTQQESYDFFLNTVKEGQEYYLGVHPSYIFDVYDKVEGAFLSTEKVEVTPPPTESEEESETISETEGTSGKDTEGTSENENNAGVGEEKNPVSPLVIVTVVVVLVAIAGAVVMVIKRKNAK